MLRKRFGLVLRNAEHEAMVFRRRKPIAVFQGYVAGERKWAGFLRLDFKHTLQMVRYIVLSGH